MNRNHSLMSLASLAMAGALIESGRSVNYGIKVPQDYDFDSILRDFRGVKPWGDNGGRYCKRPKDKKTIKRRNKNKAARKARK